MKNEVYTILTVPPSVNSLYQGRRFLTREGKEIKESISQEVGYIWKKQRMDTEEIVLDITFFFKDNRRDIDNCLKGLLDCMTGIVWKDDRQIVEIHVQKRIDKNKPRVCFQVREV